MRSSVLFAILLAVAAITALLVSRRDDGGEIQARGTVALVGDSLNVGVESYLRRQLAGVDVTADDRVGRSTSEGVDELESGRARLGPYVVVSLGTNDPPAAVDAFRKDVAQMTKLVGPGRCLVWATIWRDGAPNDRFNEILRAAAAENRRMRLVEWAEMAQSHPEWLAADGLHGNETGYRERAKAIVAAIRDCAPERTVKAP